MELQKSKITKSSFTLIEKTLSQSAQDKINQWSQFKAPVDRLDWTSHFILQAYLTSTRSLDSQTRCGCVLVKDKTIISSGYNSFIRNVDDSVLPNIRPEKYDYMIHAEHNAILNAASNGISCKGAIAYVTGKPCFNCLQFMYQAGIRNVCFPNLNLAHMSANQEAENKFEILAYLMKDMGLYLVELDDSVLQKIEVIKSF